MAEGQPTGRSFRLVLLTTFVTFCALYAPQPLLPSLGAHFEVSPAATALLMTVVFMPLAIAPLAYGALLRRFSAQRLLVLATIALGLLQFAFAFAPGFGLLVAIRAAEGVVFPASLTAAVTYCSAAGSEAAVPRRVSMYVATTILGGLGGRLIGGFASDVVGWRTTFTSMGLTLLACALVMSFAARDRRLPTAASDLSATREILSTPRFAAGFVLIGIVFFVFSGLLNALPFRLVALEPDIPAARISLVYLGYAIGVVIALNAPRLAEWLGGATRLLAVALATFTAGLALMWSAGTIALIAIGFLTAGGMFAVHATLSGYLNGLRPDEASLVNGLYIALYYLAGALGSILPILVYQSTGWHAFLATMIVLSALGVVPLRVLGRARMASRACQG